MKGETKMMDKKQSPETTCEESDQTMPTKLRPTATQKRIRQPKEGTAKPSFLQGR